MLLMVLLMVDVTVSVRLCRAGGVAKVMGGVGEVGGVGDSIMTGTSLHAALPGVFGLELGFRGFREETRTGCRVGVCGTGRGRVGPGCVVCVAGSAGGLSGKRGGRSSEGARAPLFSCNEICEAAPASLLPPCPCCGGEPAPCRLADRGGMSGSGACARDVAGLPVASLDSGGWSWGLK